MKEVKAFIHRNRIAAVIHALQATGFNQLSFIDVKGMLSALDAKEREYSLELGAEVITEVKLEVVCMDDQLDEVMALIRRYARTNQKISGWIYVNDLLASVAIENDEQET